MSIRKEIIKKLEEGKKVAEIVVELREVYGREEKKLKSFIYSVKNVLKKKAQKAKVLEMNKEIACDGDNYCKECKAAAEVAKEDN